MVFAVNPSAEKSFEAFKASAAAGGGATAGPNSGAAPAPASGSAPSSGAPAASSPVVLDPAPAGNAGAPLPSPDAGASANQQQQDPQIPGAAMSSRSVQTGWALAGVMTVVALVL